MEKIVYRKTSGLHLLENNPRTIKDRDFELLCQSIKNSPQHFEARPIILSNRTGKLVIIAGNMRYKAAIHLGFKEVPTYLMKGLTEEKEQEIVIRDNINNGEWNFEILANEWDVNTLEEWGLHVPDLIVSDESVETSNVRGKIQHTCPKCGHTWTKGDK